MQRVHDLLRAELSVLLSREIKDPRVALTSVSELDVAGDLSHATVRVSVLGDDEERRLDALAGLESAAGWIRRQLAQRLDLRRVPELHFELYRGAEHSQRIGELLEENLPDQPGDEHPAALASELEGEDP